MHDRMTWTDEHEVGGGHPVLGSDPDAAMPGAALRRARQLAVAEALVVSVPETLGLIDELIGALRFRVAGAPARVFDLSDLNADGIRLLEEVLGRGEVAGEVAGEGNAIDVMESVMPGLWRLCRRAPDGAVLDRWIEVAEVPEAVAETRCGRDVADILRGPSPDGAMNVMPVLTEIADRALIHRPGEDNHVINLSLLPMSRVDLDHLDAVLGRGPVRLRATGHGTCDIRATGLGRVWSVRFRNASGELILDTLEIGDVPVAARATDVDFAESAVRLAEIRDVYL